MVDFHNTPEYRIWHEAVLEVDNHKCIVCGSDDRVQTHHINSGTHYPDLRWEVWNGAVLCYNHHLKIHSDAGGYQIPTTNLDLLRLIAEEYHSVS